MLSNSQLFTVGNFEFRLHHLLVLGILVISFSISFMVRSQAADYGFELNEFDPFFNFRATQFIVDNGLGVYFEWHDDRSWYPQGRNVSATSQVMLHITAATLYQIFGGSSSLYDFTIIFPVVLGSFTSIVIFALVRVIGGTTAGLFSSLFFALSVPVIVRGTIGWFKSEPLGLFYGLLGMYLFLSGIKSDNNKVALIKLIGGGIFLTFGISSWGGIQFFVIPLGLFFLALPFLKTEHKFIIWAIPVFVISLLLSALAFERIGSSFAMGLGGFALVGPSIFMIACIIIQKLSKPETKIRNGLAFLAATVVGGLFLIYINASVNIISLPSFRYLNAINPFLTTTDPLVDSVAEHATTTLSQSFWFLSILMIFAAIGVWLIFRSKQSHIPSVKISNDMIGFALIIGLAGVYISSAFVRLELFASISVIILSSIGLSLLASEFLRSKKREGKKFFFTTRPITKISFVIVIVVLLLIPASLPGQASWIGGIKAPPTILNGGTNFLMSTQDWPEAMSWLKNNTPQDAVVASWWDYGYWITTLGERISLADNATLSTEQIQKIARMLLSSPADASSQLLDLGVDYVLVYAAAQRITDSGGEPVLYLLQGGGDESKKQWIMRIAGEPVSKYVHPDGLSGTNLFWQNTLLGKLFPYSPVAYVNFATNSQSETYQPGFTPIYVKDVKYSSDDEPFKLVYASPTFDRETAGPISGVFIYKINKDYVPKEQISETSSQQEPQNNEIAILTTSLGEIKIQFKENVAPKTVENFKKLARSGFYDGTLFHRIIPGFVIQGGDPNTISGSRDTWGTGGPGYSIEAELSDLKHTKYIVSMARGADINSAGSQFFIVLEDSPWLDGKYTIFGEVISGQDVVDKIASLETNSKDQPIDTSSATIQKIIITT